MLPILFHSNSFILYSYPLLMGIAWGIGYQIFFKDIDSRDMKRAQALFWGLFLSAWIGAKVLFIMTSGQSVSKEFIQSTNFWLGGGFVFYGGLILGLIYLMAFHMFLKVDSSWIKRIVLSLIWGHAIGRLGCFLAGCCYGEKTEAFWGVKILGEYRHPTQLIEAIALFIVGLILRRFNNPRKIISFYLISYGFIRFNIEFLRADKLRGLWAFGLTPSQWISIVIVILGTYLLFQERRAKPE